MALDDADKKAIAEMIAGGLKDFGGEFDKRFLTVDGATKVFKQGLQDLDLDGKIKAAVGEMAEDDDDDDDGAETAAVKKLQRQLEETNRKVEEERQARQAAEAQSRRQAMEAAVTDSLGRAGVPSARHRQALAYLQTLKTDQGEPVLDVTDGGQVVWRAQKNGYVDEIAVKEGIEAWVGTDDGKHYLPPRGSNGTGDGAGNPGGGRDASVPRDADGNIDWGALTGRLNMGAVDVVDA